MMQERVLETKGLTKIFGSKLIAVNNVNLNVGKGEILGFLGQNGAGKTTTIRLLLGLTRPSAGEVEIFGEKMNCDSAGLRRRTGYLPINPKLPPRMTPISYLNFVGELFAIGKEERCGGCQIYFALLDCFPMLQGSSYALACSCLIACFLACPHARTHS